MGLFESIAKKVLEKGMVSGKSKLSENAYKIQIQSDAIEKQEFTPGYFLRLGIGIGGDGSMKDKIRSYSIWDIDSETNTIEIAIVTHGKGVGSKWVEDCSVGDEIHFKFKKGKFLIDETADSYLMIGDLSALSHFYCIERNLPSGKHVQGLVYSQNEKDFFADLNGETPFDFLTLGQYPLKEVRGWIDEKLDKMSGKKIVYLAGDSRLCVSLSLFFKKGLGWPVRNIKTKPFWNPEKKGLE